MSHPTPKISELRPDFKGSLTCLHVTILSCVLVKGCHYIQILSFLWARPSNTAGLLASEKIGGRGGRSSHQLGPSLENSRILSSYNQISSQNVVMDRVHVVQAVHNLISLKLLGLSDITNSLYLTQTIN